MNYSSKQQIGKKTYTTPALAAVEKLGWRLGKMRTLSVENKRRTLDKFPEIDIAHTNLYLQHSWNSPLRYVKDGQFCTISNAHPVNIPMCLFEKHIGEEVATL